MFNDCIVMAGGSGIRLWPASNSRRPKQFLSISKDEAGGTSFFSSAVERALSVIDKIDGRVIIVAGKSHVERIAAACAAFSPEERKRLVLIPEPAARNTAPAIACAVLYADWVSGTERNMLVLTSDHIIQPLETFWIDAAAAAAFAQQDKLAVFGIPPRKPETGYGYIEADKRLSAPPEQKDAAWTRRLSEPEVYAVESFREKPDRKTAEQFVASRRFFWNSGMFAFSSKFILAEFRRQAPEVIRPFERLRAPDEGCYGEQKGLRILKEWPELREAYGEVKSISFDYAIAEKCSQTVMVKAGFDWIDVGNWDEYARLLENTGSEIYQTGCESCFVDSDIPVALVGVKDLIVAVRSGRDGSSPTVFIAKKGETQRVREIVEQIRAAGRTELL
ncbi:MAG: mannose-1-phosphate guanylyltransferase [Treponema sp.]|jgi:mannose-1-phosphate guanylyltransferase/mannose-1-phosphate guanylyltransferase/mannose-6-phosphate isomerase|nr:mannose-1-phosphate guanylyltransferase [Treponema sp.]